MIETVKNFWDKRPCNIRHSLLEVGTKEYFNDVEKRKYTVEPHIPEFAEFKKWKNKKVLEIGCGIGTDAINFARNGAIYTGIDLSDKSIEITRKRFEVFGLKGSLLVGDSENLTSILKQEPYDLIYSFGVIHHTPNPDKVIDAVKNYMNRDTEFKLMLYAKNSWKSIMIEAGLDQPEAQSGCPIANTFSREEINMLLKGFRILSFKQTHIFPYNVEKYRSYEYELEPWFKAMNEKMFKALEKKLGWHTLIVSKLRKFA